MDDCLLEFRVLRDHYSFSNSNNGTLSLPLLRFTNELSQTLHRALAHK